MDKFLAVNKKYFGLGLKSVDLLIISQIEEFQRNKCDCYITNIQFSEMFGESVDTIKRALTKLEGMNIIKRNTTFVEGNGRGNRQRILSLNPASEWKVQNAPTNTMEGAKITMEGANSDNGRCKNHEWKVHNAPIKDNLKEKEKDNSKRKDDGRCNMHPPKEESSKKRDLEDLSNWEIDDITRRLKNGEKYVILADKYNLKYIDKDFPTKGAQIKKDRILIAEQQRNIEAMKNEPIIDFTKLPKVQRKRDIDISEFLDVDWA